MNDLIIPWVAVGLGFAGVLGVAYSLDMRRKRHGAIGRNLPRPGPWGRALWWGARCVTAIMLLSVIGAYLGRAPMLAWIAAIGFVVFVVDHTAYRIVRLIGK